MVVVVEVVIVIVVLVLVLVQVLVLPPVIVLVAVPEVPVVERGSSTSNSDGTSGATIGTSTRYMDSQ